MHEPRIGAHNLGQMRQEGDDVMLGDRLDGVDAGDVEDRVAALFPDRRSSFLGHDADLGQRRGGVSLDLEPDAEAAFG